MGAIVGGIEDAENRAYFTTSFDGMSEGVRTAIYQQLALPEMGYVREASKDQFKWFSGSGEGAELAEEWGEPKPEGHAKHRHCYCQSERRVGRYDTIPGSRIPRMIQLPAYGRTVRGAARGRHGVRSGGK